MLNVFKATILKFLYDDQTANANCYVKHFLNPETSTQNTVHYIKIHVTFGTTVAKFYYRTIHNLSKGLPARRHL